MPEGFYPRRVPTLGGQQQQILEVIRTHNQTGLGAWDIARIIYAEDPGGGPLCADRVVQTQIGHINRKLRTWTGARIRATGGQGSVYHLEEFALDVGYLERTPR